MHSFHDGLNGELLWVPAMDPSLTPYHKRSGHSCVVAKTTGINLNGKIRIIKGNIGIVKKQRETRQVWIVHNG